MSGKVKLYSDYSLNAYDPYGDFSNDSGSENPQFNEIKIIADPQGILLKDCLSISIVCSVECLRDVLNRSHVKFVEDQARFCLLHF